LLQGNNIMSFISKKIKITYSFDTQFEKASVNLLKKLSKYGKTYFVGGYPRDILIEQILQEKYTKKDIDLCINLSADELKESLKLLNLNFKVLNDALGVYLVSYNDFNFEVACLRKDIDIGNGRKPKKIVFTKSIKVDSRRRDFTINALYFDPVNMIIYDFYNAQQDIKTRTLRFIGNPSKRIQEDYIRILRFIKFKNKYNFNYIDKQYELLKKYVNKISSINQDKVREELEDIFCLDYINKNLEELRKLRILDNVLPEIKKLEELKVKNIDIFKEIISEESFLESKVLFYILSKYLNIDFGNKYNEDNIKQYILDTFGVNIIWCIMFHDLGKPLCNYDIDVNFEKHGQQSLSIVNDIMKRMVFSKKAKEEISYIILNHEEIKSLDKMSLEEQRRFVLNKYFLETLIIYIAEIFKLDDNNIVKEDLIAYKMQPVLGVISSYININTEFDKIFSFLDDNMLDRFNIDKGSSYYLKISDEIRELFVENKLKTKAGLIKFLERKTGIVYK